MVPAAYVGVLDYAGHVAVFSLKLGVVVEFRHNDGYEYAVFRCGFADIGQTALVALAAVAASNGIVAAGVAVLIPAHEVHAHEVDTHVVVMLEPAVDIFASAGMVGHKPREIRTIGNIGGT